jgi:putative NADH-flavin reductase
MKVAIFGGTGRAGQILIDRCIALGYSVVALARNPADLSARSGLTVHPGDIRNFDTVSKVIEGCDAVLSAVGSRTLKADDVLEVGIQNIIRAMHEHGVRRIVVLGAAGALHDAMKHQKTQRRIFFWLIKSTFLKHPMRDSGNQERLLEASDLDYTVVHPPRLIDTEGTGVYRIADDGLPAEGMQIPRADVAEFMVRQLTGPTYIRKGPYIAR